MKFLPDILKFIQMINRFREVERVVYVVGYGAHQENDTEHSYQLTMVAWYFIEKFKLTLNTVKVIKYALVHDLVEVYAGDTYVYGDQEHISTKAKREHETLEKLMSDFPEFQEVWDLIKTYELKADAESQFVYALDKVLPVLNMYLDDGKIWHQEKVDLNRLLNIKKGKVDLNPEVKNLFDELVEIMRSKEDILFPKL